MASLVKYFFVKLYHAIERYVIKRRSMLRSTMARKRLLVEVEERLNRIKINGKLNGLDDTELSNLVTFHLTNKIDTPDEWNIWLRILPFVTFITIVAAMIFQHCIPCQRYSYMMGRKLLFQLSPYWDWESVYYTRCLVSKPMFWKMDGKEWPQTKLNMIECDYCDDVTQFELLTNNSKKEENANIANRMAFNIANKIPFVYNDSSLQDEIRLWPIHTFDNVVHWKKLMDELEFVTNLRHFCMFKSSIGSVHNPVQLLTQLTDDYKPEKWFAHWENCGIDMMKTIRKLYVRPSVLPPMVELSKPNWILLSQDSSSSSSSKNYSNVTKVQKYKQIRPTRATDLLIVVQIGGQVQLRLKPNGYGCEQACPMIDTISLATYQMAVVNVKHWTLSYRPVMIKSNHTNGWENNLNLSLILAGTYV